MPGEEGVGAGRGGGGGGGMLTGNLPLLTIFLYSGFACLLIVFAVKTNGVAAFTLRCLCVAVVTCSALKARIAKSK